MKILMVITSHDKLGNTGRKTGFWLEELPRRTSCSRTPGNIGKTLGEAAFRACPDAVGSDCSYA